MNLSPARQALVLQHTGIVINVARRYYKSGIPEDVISEGYVGLVEAAHRFDESRGVKFQTYAFRWVFALLMDYMIASRNIVRYGKTKAERDVFFNLGKARRAVGDETAALAAYFEVSEDRLQEMIGRLYGGEVSIDSPLSYSSRPDDVPQVISYSIPDDAGRPDQEFADSNERAYWCRRIATAVERLNPRERLIIRRRFLSEQTQTLEQIGDEMGCTRERVRQIEGVALRKLKAMLGAA
jgi:RNA polymerase sigma-32 factor